MKSITSFIVGISSILLLNSCMINKDLQSSNETVKLKASRNIWSKPTNVEDVNANELTYEFQGSRSNVSISNEPEQSQSTEDNIDFVENTLIESDINNEPTINEDVTECDFIICKNGDEIEAKVLEIGENEIKYKKCNNTEGPTISIRSSEVVMIKYPNGTKDIIKNSNNTSTSITINKGQNNSESGKSQIVAVILCFFLGGLGIHRFYLGYTGIGILMLLTGGLFGILWLIDFIRLLTGSLKPGKGEYNDSF
jgi:TM2 domain-containing membrane protein YozV